MESYRQLIVEGKIEPERPLILSTVDTLNEAIPMKMYTRYCKKRVEKYAKECNINLYYDIVTPSINDEYFVKFTGGQKLIPNASRRGDCSIILKVSPSERYVKTQLERFKLDPSMSNYSDATVISFVGSRTDEGIRRSGNMGKQGIKEKNVDDLFAEMEQSFIDKNTKLLKFAPIKQWSTDNVFDFLRISGKKPVSRMLNGTHPPIPSFLNNFALLLEIYGNGSNDVCEVAIGQTKQGAGCSGRARYGCWNCTMVANTDHSSTALTAYPRWLELGAENALRVRDYLFRLSCDMDARAFHARAFDPACYNRVALQPNVLKARFLEKMVRYASQLTVDSEIKAHEFKILVRDGREMEHPGYRDIANDPNIPPKAKKAFLEMYKECAQEPIFTSFSEEHALLLSFRWSIDGIGAAPYRPLAIWEQTKRGEGRIPYPALNSEYEAKFGKVQISDPNKPLPDALMVPIYDQENPEEFAQNPTSLYDLWTRPNDDMDIYGEDMNCSTFREAKKSSDLNLKVEFSYEIKQISNRGTLNLVDFNITESKIHSKKVKNRLLNLLRKQGVDSRLVDWFNTRAEKIEQEALIKYPYDIKLQCEKIRKGAELLFGAACSIRIQIPFMHEIDLPASFQKQPRKVKPKHQFTKRVTKVSKGKISRHNTRLVFYTPFTNSSLFDAHESHSSIWIPNFESQSQKKINTTEMACHDDDLFSVTENIQLDPKAYSEWRLNNGLEKAIEAHDKYYADFIAKRHVRNYTHRDVRRYGGSHVAESLLSSGPITISSSYWRQLQKILKRTHIFNASGMFRFQSYTYKELESHPATISMVQHRNDKALIMKHIKGIRNKQRTHIKLDLMKHNQNQYGSSVSTQLSECLPIWANAALSCLKIIESNWANQSHIFFDTHEVHIKRRAEISRYWLLENTESLGGIDTLWKKLLPAKQMAILKSSKAHIENQAINYTRQEIAPLINQCSGQIIRWEAILKQLKTLLSNTEDNDDAKTFRTEVKSCIFSNLPKEYLVDNLFPLWKPKTAVAKKQIQLTLKCLEEDLSIINSFLDKLKGWQEYQTAKNSKLDNQLLLL